MKRKKWECFKHSISVICVLFPNSVKQLVFKIHLKNVTYFLTKECSYHIALSIGFSIWKKKNQKIQYYILKRLGESLIQQRKKNRSLTLQNNSSISKNFL